MREIPRRERIGRKALVHHRQSGDQHRVLQIEIEGTDLIGEQHAFVHNRQRRHGRDVKLFAVTQSQRLNRMPGALTDDVELTFECVLIHVLGSATDEHLPNHGFDSAHAITKTGVINGYVTPPEQHLTFGGNRAFNFLLTGHARRRLLRQEHHAYAVLTDSWQRNL